MTLPCRPSPPPTRAPDDLPLQTRRGFRWRWLVVVLLVLVGVGAFVLIAFNRAIEGWARIACSSNLRQIGLAMSMYADAHDGVLPPDWRTLGVNTEITSDVFVSPYSRLVAERAPGNQPAVWGPLLDEPNHRYSSYTNAAGGLLLKSLRPDDVLAFEPVAEHDDEGLNILFVDGHADWFDTNTAAGRAAYDRLLADYAAGVRPLRWRKD